ncbi:unnamed protein product [Sphagnum jensenii]|uniref:Uncharacterized protein n=1 Tax=Sphagnum jensenii TaxID=128206 RepID=A0ABP0WF37_9BRYO
MGVGVFASSPQILSLSCSPSSPPSLSVCCCPSSLEVILADVGGGGGGGGGKSLTRRASDIAAVAAVAASASSSSSSSSCLELVLLKDGRRSSLTRRASDVAAMAGSVGFLQAELKSLKNSSAAAATAAPNTLTTGSSLRRSLSSGPSLLLLRRVSQECGTDPIFRSKSSGNSRDVGRSYQVEGGAQLPVSLRKLKRRHVEGKGTATQESDCGCSIRKAFASMVFMIGAMQSYVLQMRQALFSEWDAQEVLFLVHQELNTSFVWLFQQVFACTPKLMVSVMILLANFTVFSMGERIAVAAEVFNPPSAIIMSVLEERQAGLGMDSDAEEFAARALSSGSFIEDTPEVAGGGIGSSGGNNSKPVSVAGDSDGDSCLGMLSKRNTMFSEKDSGLESYAPGQVSDPHRFGSAQSSSSSSLSASSGSPVVKEREPLQHVKLDQETIRRLVAPVTVDLEPDNYACFDRTDLEYQHAISMQDTNTLLLANYAQFLYVVRHDNNRAEDFFHRALQVDPSDGEILGRFASFLWLGRGNKEAAERAYKAAIASDPQNPYHAGSYAHFLWHTCDEETSCSLGPSITL